MTNESPAVENTLAQMQDYPIIDLLWIVLEGTALLKKRGMKIQPTPDGTQLIMYRRPADLIGRAQYNGHARPTWTPTPHQQPPRRLQLTTRTEKA